MAGKRIDCPNCGAVLKVGGGQMVCPYCDTRLNVPAGGNDRKPPESPQKMPPRKAKKLVGLLLFIIALVTISAMILTYCVVRLNLRRSRSAAQGNSFVYSAECTDTLIYQQGRPCAR